MKYFQLDFLTKDKQEIILEILKQYSQQLDGDHGVHHWLRVFRNSLIINSLTNDDIDIEVTFWFSMFHDCKRQNENKDPGHGERAARYIEQYKSRLGLSDHQYNLLIRACSSHTDTIKSLNPTVAACYDSDRLDLYRVNIYPLPEFLNHQCAKSQNIIESRSKLAQEWFWDLGIEEMIGLDLQSIIEQNKHYRN